MIALMLMLAAPVSATCAATVPAPISGWASPADQGNLALGRPLRIALTPGHTFAATTRKAPAAGTSGGSATFAVDRPGTYEIALSAPAWIDVVDQGKALSSTAHRHGPDCSGIRKIVTFRLHPGSYTLQISGTPVPAVTTAISRAGD